MFGLEDAQALARASMLTANFTEESREEWRAIAAEIERIRAVWDSLP
jgi:hypothetical protein